MLIVVAIISVLAAIAVANLLPSLERSRQKKTMASMRNISVAVEQYHGDFATLPQSPNLSDLVTLLNATGYRVDATKDAWGHEMTWAVSSRHYTIESYGRDGLDGPFDMNRATARIFEADLVLSDGAFVAGPES